MFTDEERIAHLEEDVNTLRKAIMQAKGCDPRMYQRPEPGGTPVLVRCISDMKATLSQATIKLDVVESERIATKLEENSNAD